MRRARVARMSWSIAASMIAAAACSSFGSEEGPPAPPAEAGAEARADAGACTLAYVDDPSAKPNDKCGPGGAAVDLSSDSSHCGACGHGCAGGACDAGRCVFGKVAIPGVVVMAKVRDNIAFYVTQGRQVGNIALDTSNVGTPFTTFLQQSVVRRIDFDATSVYVSTSVEQLRFSRETGLSETLPLATTAAPGGVVAIGESSYFYASAGGVERHKKVPPDAPLTLPAAALTVVADGEQAFWLVKAAAGVEVWGTFPDGALLTSAKSAAVAALDATHVYFSDLDAQQIRRVPRGGGNSERVAKEPATNVGDIMADGEFVYWTADRGSIDGWVLMRVSKCGGLPLVLAKNMNQLTQLSADAKFVYVANVVGAQGELVRIPK